MYILNGKKLNINLPVVGPDGTQYPAGWFNNPEQRVIAGVIEVDDPVWPDPDLYRVTENEDGSLTITERTPVEIDARKAALIPQEVSKFQARAALYQFGLLDQIENLMQDANTPVITKLAWQDAQVFRRNSPTVLALGAQLGLTSADLDNLFIEASKIFA